MEPKCWQKLREHRRWRLVLCGCTRDTYDSHTADSYNGRAGSDDDEQFGNQYGRSNHNAYVDNIDKGYDDLNWRSDFDTITRSGKCTV